MPIEMMVTDQGSLNLNILYDFCKSLKTITALKIRQPPSFPPETFLMKFQSYRDQFGIVTIPGPISLYGEILRRARVDHTRRV